MCGRFALTITRAQTLKERFGIHDVPQTIQPRYNIAPTQHVPVISNDQPHEFSMFKWGLIPHWTKDVSKLRSMINARSETILERPSFREPFRSQRCLIPADSFYEWQQGGRFKRPFRILMQDEHVFSFAGIWDRWQHKGLTTHTFAIITTEANELIKPIHNRMPVILDKEQEELWLADSSPAQLFSVLKPYDTASMCAHEISSRINSPEHDSPEVIQKIEEV